MVKWPICRFLQFAIIHAMYIKKSSNYLQFYFNFLFKKIHQVKQGEKISLVPFHLMDL